VNGKYYAEFTSTTTLPGNDTGIGIATSSAPLGSFGTAASGGCAAFTGTGNIYLNGSATGIAVQGVSGLVGTVWQIALDLTNSRVWFRCNNNYWNDAAINNPATNVGGINISTLFPANAAYAIFCANASGVGFTANFGASAFTYAIPSGFTAWG
jgi:hypothetical protein